MTLAERTTLGVGGPADSWIVGTDADTIVSTVIQSDREGVPVLLLGGGSNMLVADDGFRGTVVEVATHGVQVDAERPDPLVTAAAGEEWDAIVARAVADGWAGIEALSGIPGRVGATPIQNVGAYGQEVGQVIESVRALDRSTGAVVTLAAPDCRFAYRTSELKRQPDRWVVLDVSFRLRADGRSPVRYAELARVLGVAIDDEVEVARIRAGVLDLRRAKGMVLDDFDPDTRSAGSFFMNPVVSTEVAAALPDSCPRYPADVGVKLSAAWLIEQSGIDRGFRARPESRARISGKHTLALVAEPGATAAELLELARVVRGRVHERFGITLQAEARLVGCAL